MTAINVPTFTPREWFWRVGEDEALWSSASAIEAGDFQSGYVDEDDARHQAFTGRAMPTKIRDETELRDLSIAVVPGLEMLSRLSGPEYAAIRAAEVANLATIGRWLDMLRVNGRINLFGLTAEEARAGLVAAGLLTEQRAFEIFRFGS